MSDTTPALEIYLFFFIMSLKDPFYEEHQAGPCFLRVQLFYCVSYGRKKLPLTPGFHFYIGPGIRWLVKQRKEAKDTSLHQWFSTTQILLYLA